MKSRIDVIGHNGPTGEHYDDKDNFGLPDHLRDVLHPRHYTSHPSGVECIDITRHMNFCLGNAMKYIWRAGLKDDAVKDLEKAKFYIDQEIALRSVKEEF